ncbi:hypothetical protein NQ317_007297 [Molorchus minor]|uniref:MYND-type domain-containing protein n=1 Tax=Molorchus minor TaxID=1323400 RepID=A0ABQ9JX84_9CUCU|nr:hypothetical protein NQ317_007297 [Molorchus minor]
MPEEGNCEICQKPASQKCGKCHSVYYCSKEHQKNGWKVHKKLCKPFKICHDETLGRHLVATKDIKPGDIILQEPALIWGPSQITVPVCLGCCKPLDEKYSRPCFKCGWPVCSETCEKAPAHIPECRYTVLRGDRVSIKNFGVVHPTYQCITVLRCLYQKQFLPEVWKKIDRLQSHCEERKSTRKYEQDRVAIAKFILRFFKLANVFTEEEILRVCGIVMINSHEVPLTQSSYIAMYESTSMFEHSCSANCSKSFTNKGNILIASGTYIKESDCKGHLLPQTFIENNNEKGSDWQCNKCQNVTSAYSVHDLLERIGKDLAEVPKGVSNECKEFIKSYEKFLHRNHFYLTDVKVALSQIIGQEFEDGLPAVSEEDLELKAKLCQGLSDLIKALVPGKTNNSVNYLGIRITLHVVGERRVRGILLFELHAAIAEMGRRRRDPEELHTILLRSKEVLEESVDLLKYEPDSIQEGKIYKQAVMNLKELEFVLKTVHKTLGDSPM